ncbi:unnamed protein product [Blumeria hordei]|uniref:SH3 domain-containing protein n=1 Tax=Blumeria hordei TaxID=2867405 RepID=A0A383UGY2_BLUHO|nr:unnamed protein product [Blumeria hordei]
MAHRLLKVKAIYEYTSQHEDDLHFSCGQVITITGEEDDEWYSGEYIDESGIQHKGIFPKNFVENHEPVAPPRPNRIIHLNETQSTAEPSSQLTPLTAENSPAIVEPLPIPTEKICDMRDPTSQPLTTDCSASLSKSHPGKTSQSQSPPQNTKLHSVTSAPSQPSEKPVSNTLKDRIAAFNKAATPVIPFKQPGLTSRSANNFIKKPFVAPPPSKNAFVPLPKDQSIQRVYRREEEKEFSTKTSENKENSDRPLLATGENLIEEEPPKQTSLKERIALLQKQQLEQASRLSDLNYKKDKSKRNNKKHTDINANTDHEDGNEILNERNKDCDAPRKISIDLEKEEPSNLTCQKLVGTDPETCGANYTKPMKGATEVSSSINEETRDNEGKNIKLESQTGILDEQSSSISQCEYEPQQKNIIETTSISDDNDSDDGNHDDDDDYEDAEVDLEIKRKEELRARIAKMSGGMGMHGMMGPPSSLQFPSIISASKIKSNSCDKRPVEAKAESTQITPTPAAPPPNISQTKPQDFDCDDVNVPSQRYSLENTSQQANTPHVLPQEFIAPQTPKARPTPSTQLNSRHSIIEKLVISEAISTSDKDTESLSQDPCQESYVTKPSQLYSQESLTYDESVGSCRGKNTDTNQSLPDATTLPMPNRTARPSPPTSNNQTLYQERPVSYSSPENDTINFSHDDLRSENTSQSNSTNPQEEEREESQSFYESSEAPTQFPKRLSQDVTRVLGFTDDAPQTLYNRSAPSLPPPLPKSAAPRGPPNPLQFVSSSRLSMDMPRSAPPPPPNNNPASWDQNDDEHNSQRYTVPKKRAPSVPSMIDPSFRLEGPEYDLYSASPPRSPYGVQERNFSQYPQRDPITPAGARALPRKSIEISRSTTTTRRSTDITRISLDSGFVANDIDLAPMSFWWTQLNGIPAALQGKKDILFESEEKTSYQGGKTMIKKEIYVLFQDYSQTILSAYFDSQNPADVKLEQTHEQPPSRLRQDQLEQAHENLGRRLYDEIITRKDSIVGDGTPHGLITELLKPLPNVLHPVGSRAYGALIYGNIANASVQQRDEIRPGDIITFRNSKFQGKHGPLNAKYSIEVGKPEHVGIVAEWDGTKKKIRAWEQGRESKKVKLESFKLEDLRSGEVKVWRVMPRSWVGWIVDK